MHNRPYRNEAAEMPVSEYEEARQQRIKENTDRLQKLGIFTLSSTLKSLSSPCSSRSVKRNITPQASPSVRRSSRLKIAPVFYTDNSQTKTKPRVSRKKKTLKNNGSDSVLKPKRPRQITAEKPEVYTSDDERLLGNTERKWVLFVDGCGGDGKRIYDSVNGMTCHQCRQKTLGRRTRCSTCKMGQGQFCGDCLYMRYGEHVEEALENSGWVCPVCRGICNCSFCRQGKGWPPTGALYRKVVKLGFRSVAHYLVRTRRAQPLEEGERDAKVVCGGSGGLRELES